MKIDLKQLAKIEKQYRMNDNQISLGTLELMIGIVLKHNDTSFKLAPNNVQMAISTLKELGIYKDEGAVEQLNS